MSIGAASSVSAASSSANLTIEDFLKVLLTQLTFQDPMKPMDNQEFMAQIAQFTTLQQTQEVNTNIQTLLTNQSAFQSVGMLGRTVDVSTGAGSVTGRVIAISLSGVTPKLTVQPTNADALTNVDLGQITGVRS